MSEKRWTYGGNGSHWEGCAEVHWDCKIAELEAENARMKHDYNEETDQFNAGFEAGQEGKLDRYTDDPYDNKYDVWDVWRLGYEAGSFNRLTAENTALKSEIVSKDKKLTDYEIRVKDMLYANKRLRHALEVIADSNGHHDHSLTHSQLIEYAKDALDFVSTKKETQSVYIVTMYRYGDREKHSYVLGAYSAVEIAIQHGELEEYVRGGKYKMEFVVCDINKDLPLPPEVE